MHCAWFDQDFPKTSDTQFRIPRRAHTFMNTQHQNIQKKTQPGIELPELHGGINSALHAELLFKNGAK